MAGLNDIVSPCQHATAQVTKKKFRLQFLTSQPTQLHFQQRGIKVRFGLRLLHITRASNVVKRFGPLSLSHKSFNYAKTDAKILRIYSPIICININNRER